MEIPLTYRQSVDQNTDTIREIQKRFLTNTGTSLDFEELCKGLWDHTIHAPKKR